MPEMAAHTPLLARSAQKIPHISAVLQEAPKIFDILEYRLWRFYSHAIKWGIGFRFA
jgi:hypothetical protein